VNRRRSLRRRRGLRSRWSYRHWSGCGFSRGPLGDGTVDVFLARQDFTVRTYQEQFFEAKCVSYAGQVEVARTSTCDLRKVKQYSATPVLTFALRYTKNLKAINKNSFRIHPGPLFAAMTKC
jgi:hypothetical protein